MGLDYNPIAQALSKQQPRHYLELRYPELGTYGFLSSKARLELKSSETIMFVVVCISHIGSQECLTEAFPNLDGRYPKPIFGKKKKKNIPGGAFP